MIGLLEQQFEIKSWRFSWRFPFIKRHVIVGTLFDFQRIVNEAHNVAIDKEYDNIQRCLKQ